jgi:hypothetical protein
MRFLLAHNPIYYFEPGEFHILEKEFVLFSQSCQKTHKKVFSGLWFSLALTKWASKTRDEPKLNRFKR